MNVRKLSLAGLALLVLHKFEDDRGFFTERFRLDLWKSFLPRHTGFAQDNYSWSKYRVLRGLHFQLYPAQGKLVTCIEGSIVDVAVDLRPYSATFGQHFKVELSASDPSWLWIPPGFAHGFQVISPKGAGVLYKVDAPYNPQSEKAIHFGDPKLAITWPVRRPILSLRDANAPSFNSSIQF